MAAAHLEKVGKKSTKTGQNVSPFPVPVHFLDPPIIVDPGGEN